MRLYDIILSSRLKEFEKRLLEMQISNLWYVTELTQCPKKHVFRVQYPHLKLANIVNARLLLGDIIHNGLEVLIAFRIPEARIEQEIEKKVKLKAYPNADFIIKGRADIVTEHYVYEVKTIKSINNDRKLPLDHHVQQLLAYLDLFNKDYGRIVYVVLNEGKILEYDITREKELTVEDMLLEQLERLRNKDYPIEEWECNYCIYKDVCDRVIE